MKRSDSHLTIEFISPTDPREVQERAFMSRRCISIEAYRYAFERISGRRIQMNQDLKKGFTEEERRMIVQFEELVRRHFNTEGIEGGRRTAFESKTSEPFEWIWAVLFPPLNGRVTQES